MKKLISLAAGLGLALTVSAANYVEQPLLTGWNLYITNNGVAVVNTTNNLYTLLNGQVVYSMTNNLGNTNTIWPDAFVAGGVSLKSDANGDYVANAAIHYYLNNTNWIPQVVTNAYGQYVISNNWVLLPSLNPTYMPPATTNYYPGFLWSGLSNSITFNIQRGWKYNNGSYSIVVWDTSTNLFSFSVSETFSGAVTPVSGVTNLPTVFTQGADFFRCQSITCTTNGASGGAGTNMVLVNALSIGQPQP